MRTELLAVPSDRSQELGSLQSTCPAPLLHALGVEDQGPAWGAVVTTGKPV